MRIALVSKDYPPTRHLGGIGTQTYHLAHGLTALGHDIHVITVSPDPKSRYEEKTNGVSIIRTAQDPGPNNDMPLAEWIGYSARIASELWSLHRKTPLDLVKFADYHGEGFVHLTNREYTSPIPVVIQLHAPIIDTPEQWPETYHEVIRLAIAQEGVSLRLADGVCSNCNWNADWAASRYRLRRERIPTLHAGVDTDLFRPGNKKEERPTIAFVGRITKEKGCDLLVKAACKLAEEYPDLQLWLIGRVLNDNFQEELQATARAFPNLLRFCSHIERQDLPAYLSRAHVFGFVPVFETGPSNACLEAMACGLPVIITRVGGMPEMVEHEETGLIVPPGDFEASVAALRRLIGDGGLRTNMGARARDYTVKTYDRQKCLRRIEAFYKAVAAGVDDFEGKPVLHPGKSIRGPVAIPAERSYRLTPLAMGRKRPAGHFYK